MFNYEKSKDESWWKTLRSAGNTREIQRTITSANLTQTEEAVTSALRRKGTSLALRGWIWKADDGATSNAAGQHHPALLLALVCMHTTREINLKSLQQCRRTQAPAGHSCTLQHKLQLEVRQQARKVWFPAKKQGSLGLRGPLPGCFFSQKGKTGHFHAPAPLGKENG